MAPALAFFIEWSNGGCGGRQALPDSVPIRKGEPAAPVRPDAYFVVQHAGRRRGKDRGQKTSPPAPQTHPFVACGPTLMIFYGVAGLFALNLTEVDYRHFKSSAAVQPNDAVRRIHAKKKAGISRRHEIRFLALLTAGLCVPTLGILMAIFWTAEPDISDLTPVSRNVGDYVILHWSDLERGRPHALLEDSSVFAGARVRALGYMMEGERLIRTGERVHDFFLLPQGGNLLHPAHRFGDQMIAVHLRSDIQVQFSPRSLVWVAGTFRASLGDPVGARPLYDLEEARVSPASKAEIRKYFR